MAAPVWSVGLCAAFLSPGPSERQNVADTGPGAWELGFLSFPSCLAVKFRH